MNNIFYYFLRVDFQYFYQDLPSSCLKAF